MGDGQWSDQIENVGSSRIDNNHHVFRGKSRLRLPKAIPIPPDLPELSASVIDRMMRGELNFQK